jgi:hypothetical protein
MLLAVLAVPALAASPTLTVRRDCDAFGGLPTVKEPLVVSFAGDDPNVGGEVTLGTLAATTADTSFSILLDGAASDRRSFELVAFSAEGAALGKAVVDVDLATGEVIAADGADVSLRRLHARDELEGRYDLDVTLEDEVATGAAMVTLTDLTGDGAVVTGDPLEQALALLALTEKGRGLVGGYTFDDAHAIDRRLQTWEGTVAVDAAWDGAELAFSAGADHCLPEGADAPADGTVEWTETLTLRGSAKSPKWKSVTLGLRSAETEVWRLPFVARVEDASAEGVRVSLTPVDGGTSPRATEVRVAVPARERLSGSGTFARTAPSSTAQTETLTVKLSQLEFNSPVPVVTVTVTLADGVLTCGGDAPADCGDVPFDSDGDGFVDSYATIGGLAGSWDGTLEVTTRGPAVWGDLEVTATWTDGAGKEEITFPLATVVSVFEGDVVFDADPSGYTYRWDCGGCGDDFDPFDIQAQFGTGTRSTASTASTKAELL